jgi:hypothetical protein
METFPPAAAVWVPTPPSLSRLCYISFWFIAVVARREEELMRMEQDLHLLRKQRIRSEMTEDEDM